MPLYEYKCSICNNYEEVLEPLNTIDCHDCHSCGVQNAMQRRHSVIIVHESNNSPKPAVRPTPSCKGRSCDCPYAK
jgi:putative FmdB family regulatory protein